ncbi:MAG TPA: LysE family transporter [Opitutaceae bacterium]|nr:LysE family transporter [Opitutaceae bacterium]
MAFSLEEFLTLSGLHLLAVASPGPDFALVLRQSIVYGRSTALATSLGIGSGIFLHVAYSLLGLGLMVQSSLFAFTVMKWIGAAYLMWIGFQALRAPPRRDEGMGEGEALRPALTRRSAYLSGFITNATNIKATLFFVSVFSVVVNPQTPRWIQAGYGVWMAVTTAIWFMAVSLFFTQLRIRRTFIRFGHWFDRAMGCVLLALGVRLALAHR